MSRDSSCLYFVCDYDHSQNKLWPNVGSHCLLKKLLQQTQLKNECTTNTNNNSDMKMTEDSIKSFNRATCCYLCNTQV